MTHCTIGLVDALRLGRLHRLLRHRARLTQEEVSRRARVARWRIVLLEAGRARELRLGDVEQCFAVLDAGLEVRAWYHGAAADRLLDEVHARLVGRKSELLLEQGWIVHAEVTFAEFGDRGSIDLLGWHPETRALLVDEMKSEIGSVEGTLRPFDIKSRLAPRIVRQRFGWKPAIVGRMLVLPDDRTVRRTVDRHAVVLRGALPARSRALRSWIAMPSGNVAGIWFLSVVQPASATRNPSSIQRVRRARARSDNAS